MADATAGAIGTASALSGETPMFCSIACTVAVSVINKMAALISRICCFITNPIMRVTLERILWLEKKKKKKKKKKNVCRCPYTNYSGIARLDMAQLSYRFHRELHQLDAVATNCGRNRMLTELPICLAKCGYVPVGLWWRLFWR